MDLLLELAKTHGIVTAIAIFLIWSQNKNYTGVCKRLNEVEDYNSSTMANIIQKNTEAITRFNENVIRCMKRSD
jgi:hypothetical protein